jgi:hypothetical protein
MQSTDTATPLVADDAAALVTGGRCPTEQDACIVLDHKLKWCDLFNVYKEVSGWYLNPRPGCPLQRPRVDRLLTPKQALIAAGWPYGSLAIEVKASGMKLGPMVAQAMDYGRAVFEITGGNLVLPTWTFLWPAPDRTVGGTIMSLLVQNRIGLIEATNRVPLSLSGWAAGRCFACSRTRRFTSTASARATKLGVADVGR